VKAPTILSLDTSTEACSAAVISGKTEVSRFEIAPRQHANKILQMIHEVLEEGNLSLSEVDAIAVGQGPGSFTGVRLGIGVAKGLSFGADIPVIPVSTLKALSMAYASPLSDTVIVSAIDARMSEVYWAVYKGPNRDILTNDSLSRPENISALPPSAFTGCAIGLGSGFGAYKDALVNSLELEFQDIQSDCYPEAIHIAKAALPLFLNGQTIKSEELSPVYLRNDVVR